MIKKILFNQKITISEDVLTSQVEDELVLLHLERESYYGLDAVGLRMWTVLLESETIEEGVRKLLKEYDVDENTLRQDVLSLVEKLVEHGVVNVT